jgi:GxxExxY protein
MLTNHPLNSLTSTIIKCAIEVHRVLGPGLLESIYTTCLTYELRAAGLRVETEVALPVKYKSMTFDCGYKIDLLVEDAVIVEVKSVAEIGPVHPQQLLTYMKTTGREMGLLINFNVPLLKDGIKRLMNTPK